MNKQEIIKAVNNFRGANREFSQELGPIIESILGLVSAVVAPDITALTKEQLDNLQPGDVVAKKTGNQYHTYVVSYKGEGAGEGICLTYVDASTVETVSYDRGESGWSYNSTDITPLAPAPETHVLEILNFGDFDGEQVFLSNLLLDGHQTTLEELRSLVGETLFLKYTNEHMILVTYQRVQSELFEFYGCVPVFDDTPVINVVRVVWEGGDYGYIETTGSL